MYGEKIISFAREYYDILSLIFGVIILVGAICN